MRPHPFVEPHSTHLAKKPNAECPWGSRNFPERHGLISFQGRFPQFQTEFIDHRGIRFLPFWRVEFSYSRCIMTSARVNRNTCEATPGLAIN